MLNNFNSNDNPSKNNYIKSPALNQGKKFKKYQTKIVGDLEKQAKLVSGKEGFSSFNENGLTYQTDTVIADNNYSTQQQTINNLRQEYQNTLQQYEDLAKKISGNVSGYINRVNPNNPYLNKVIQFSSGQVCYVTNQGVAKYIPSTEIWKTLNISKTPQIQLNISWQDSYSTSGIQIPTTPPLVSGTPVVSGQSFGNEGSNVFVNQLLSKKTNPSYMGCYAAGPDNDNMTFIGGEPPSTDVSIKNGNFNQPVLSNNSYKYLTGSSVPGWYFNNAVLMNNSSAWGFPIPYPNGNQCVSLQNESYISTLLNLSTGVNYTLTFYACGRNCCNSTNNGNPINIQLYTNLNAYVSQIESFTPTVNSWTSYSTTFTVPTTQSYNLYFTGTNTSGDQSTAIQNISLSSASASSGTYTYNDCMQSAIQQGYQYFALQNVNTETSTGYCAVTNSSPAISQYGNSLITSKMITLWSSNTSGQPGNTAILSNTGSLQVLNSSGQAVYSSPASKANPANYLGCYGDSSSNPAMSNVLTDGSQQYDSSSCQQSAQEQGYQYYGLQNSTSGTNAQCFLSNDITQTTQYGAATNCTQISNGSWSGGGLSNAVYNATTAQSNYYLILQNNGNMCIYRGTGPNDNQGLIWKTNTNGKQQDANPNVTAAQGKYGQNWMPSSGTLSPGDFVGSSDGKIALVMRADGNLVLYAYQMTSNCRKMNDGNTGGGILANAAYNIGTVAVPGNIGKLAFIDSNSELHSYESSEQTYSNTYSVINNANTSQGNIDGASFGGATLESCTNACNENSECAGFSFSDNTCYPKNNTMYPYGGTINSANGVDTYIRNVIPSSPPIGVTQNTRNIDTIKYGSYVDGGTMDSEYGLANVSSVDKQRIEQLQTKLNLLSNQLSNLTSKFETGATTANNQGVKNNYGIGKYVQDIKSTNNQIKQVAEMTTSGLQNILKDSDIIVLQKNYEYLFWSILAVGTVLISMSLAKK